MRVALASLAVMVSALPAAGVGVGFGGDANIDPKADFSACATVVFNSDASFVGTFTAVAEMQGPSTKASTVRMTIPIHGIREWTGCIPGGYFGATVGEGKYVVEASGESGEVYEVVQCALDMGAFTCTG